MFKNYTIHSGGAHGSDFMWGTIGKEFGVENIHHYYIKGYNTPYGNKEISYINFEYVDKILHDISKILGRIIPKNEYVKNLLRRNWWQIKDSDAVYAIADVVNGVINGGTAWGVSMGILKGIPIYIFNQNNKIWYKLINNDFIEIKTPKLVNNFSGIGTRKINEFGITAIRDVFEKTLVDNNDIVCVDKTLNYGVLKNYPVYSHNGINTMRKQGYKHFGNPFTHLVDIGDDLISVKTIKNAVNAYSDWLLGINYPLNIYNPIKKTDKRILDIKPDQRRWVTHQISSGKLENTKLLYMNKIGYKSHADVLFDMVNKNGVKPIKTKGVFDI
jgi:hypothetical protein